jgi:TolB-like protein
MGSERYAFGPFVLDSRRKALLRNGLPLAIGHRGFVLLERLIGAEGRAVSKSDLMDAAWQTTNIEESNLSVQIAALRKILGRARNGEEWIVTVQRVGYQFVRHDDAGATQDEQVPSPALSTETRPTIAVLPFANMSSDPEQEYFADGLAEDLITDLSKVPGLTVIARHSSFAFKGRALDIRQIGKELGARYIVEGSVRRAASRVRINATLLDTTTNAGIWADRFDRDLTDVFSLLDEVVGQIVKALAFALPSPDRIESKRPHSLEAYDLFIRGRSLVTESPKNNRIGRDLLLEAIRMEPDFADAHAWLAASHHFPWAYMSEATELHRPLARDAAEKAVALDPENAFAHGILGDVLIYDGQAEAGAAEIATALRINPSLADAWMFMTDLHVLEGRPREGVACAEKALQLNPHPPAFYYWFLSFAQYAAGQYATVIENLSSRAAYRTGSSQRILAAALAQLGRLEEARREAEDFLNATPHFTISDWARTQPFRNKDDIQRFIDGYHAAGLPM